MSEGEPINQEPVNVEENKEQQDSANQKEARDSFKLYVSNLNNFMSQKEALKLFRDRNISGIKYVISEFVIM